MVVKVFRVTDKNFELWWQWVILQTFSKPHLTFSTLTGGEWRSADLLHSGCHAWAQPFQTTNKGPKGSIWWGGHLELQWKWIQATIIGWRLLSEADVHNLISVILASQASKAVRKMMNWCYFCARKAGSVSFYVKWLIKSDPIIMYWW